MNDEREIISYDEAVARLPEGDTVHTFRQAGPALIGTNVDREELLEALSKAGEIEVTGPTAQSMNHGLAIQDEHGPLFIETRESLPVGGENIG